MKRAIFVLGLAAGAMLCPSQQGSRLKSDNIVVTATAQTATLRTRDLLWQKMAAEVGVTERNFPGVMGIVIRDLADGRELRIHADEIFPAASSIKVPVLLELFRQSQDGKGARLTDLYTPEKKYLVDSSAVMENLTPGVSRVTNRDLAGFVAAVSDNTAANILIDRVGMDRVNQMLDGLGLHATRLRRKMMDLTAAREGRENTSTPAEEVALFELIYRGKALDDEHTAELMRILCTEKASYLPRLLPEDLRIANKPGSLAGVRNDSGIVLLKNHPFAISVMTVYARDGAAAEDAISNVARAAYRYFEAVENASDLGRDLGP